MKISTKGRYALRIMVDLAINGNGKFISLKNISERQQISNKYLEQIISMLNKAGFLETARGNMGGYRLAKAPSEYKIGDILRATERDLGKQVSLLGPCAQVSNYGLRNEGRTSVCPSCRFP